MFRYAAAILCLLSVLALGANGQQKTSAEPVSIAAGTILRFHTQTRLSPGGGNEIDALPKGTVLRVRLSEGIDSGINRDGSEFRGEIVAPVVSEKGGSTVIRAGAEALGLFVLLRSRNHPEGFRYELLLTQIVDGRVSYDLTASLDTSLADSTADSASAATLGPAAAPR
jgi:hypothetical protein